MKFGQIILLCSLMSGLPYVANWKADVEKAKIGFSVKGPFGTVHGNFSGLKATIVFDEKDLAGSSVSASVEAKTVSTGVGLRNHDLKSKEEWFNADKFPLISFHSKQIAKSGPGFKAIGELTIKGVTKPLDMPFTFTGKESTGLFKSQFTIKREEYKLGKDGGSVGSVITIMLEVPVKK